MTTASGAVRTIRIQTTTPPDSCRKREKKTVLLLPCSGSGAPSRLLDQQLRRAPACGSACPTRRCRACRRRPDAARRAPTARRPAVPRRRTAPGLPPPLGTASRRSCEVTGGRGTFISPPARPAARASDHSHGGASRGRALQPSTVSVRTSRPATRRSATTAKIGRSRWRSRKARAPSAPLVSPSLDTKTMGWSWAAPANTEASSSRAAVPEASSLAPCVESGGESRGASTTIAP